MKRLHYVRISILCSNSPDFYIVDNYSIAAHAIPMRILISISVDVIFLPTYVKCFANFRGLPFKMEVAPSYLNMLILFYLH